MANYTLEEALRCKQAVLDAYLKAINAKSMSVGGKGTGGYSKEAQDIEALEKQLDKWDKIINEIKREQKSKSPFQIGSAICKR